MRGKVIGKVSLDFHQISTSTKNEHQFRESTHILESVDIDENKLPKVASDCHPVAAPLAVFSLAKWILHVLGFM